MVQTRAQLKTTTSSSATEKPASKRTAKSATAATAASAEKAKPKTTKKDESKTTKRDQLKTIKKDELKTTKKEDGKTLRKDEPKASKLRTEKSEEPAKTQPKITRKATTKSIKKVDSHTITVVPQSLRAKVESKTEVPVKKAQADANAAPKKSSLKTSRLGNPIKPKRKVVAATKDQDAATSKTPAVDLEKAPGPIVEPISSRQPPSKAADLVPNNSPILEQDTKPSAQTIDRKETTTNSVELAPSAELIEEPVFKVAILSPTKPLGSPIKPTVSARVNRMQDSPKRASPSKVASIKKMIAEKPILREVDMALASNSIASSTKTIGLSPFKSIGTPIRRAFTSSLFSSKMSATAAPAKRFATDSPWRPMSAQGEKRIKLSSSPKRPQTADTPQIPNSCLRNASTLTSAKKCVSFQSPGGDGSPKRSQTVSKLVLAPPVLPRLSEGQETEMEIEQSPEPEPLPLSEVLNIEFSPETGQSEQAVSSILKNVTFYVDIWGSDGSCASQYFVPLLEELGAKVSKEWTDEITHVLFKDGDMKTVQRIAKSKGAIKGVNVGWALE